MSSSTWVKVPISLHAPRWSTLSAERTVLVVVHTMASANRLLDVVPLFGSDLRVQLVFSCPGTSAVSEGVTDLLDQLGAVTTPWTQAIHTPFDLIVTASNSGNLNELNGPIVVMSHGVGYSKYSLGIANRESRIANRESRIANRPIGLRPVQPVVAA